MYLNTKRFRNKKTILLPCFFIFLSILIITLFTIIPMTFSFFVYAAEENTMLEDKKCMQNNIDNNNTNTNTNNKTKEIEKLLDIAKEHYLSGEYKEAIQYYDKVLAIDGNDTGALVNKGLVLDDLGQYQEAITYYDRALAIDGNDTNALVNKGNALNILGQHKEAITYYDRVLAIDGNDDT